MQPKTYIYSKLAFFRLILSGFHFTEKRKKLSFGNKNENKRGNLSVLVIPRNKPAIPKVKETVPEDHIQVFRHSLIGCFLFRNRNLILTSNRPYFRLRSHSDSCGNTQPALSWWNGSRKGISTSGHNCNYSRSWWHAHTANQGPYNAVSAWN